MATARLRDEPDVSYLVYAPIAAIARDLHDPAGIVRLDADIRRISRPRRRVRSVHDTPSASCRRSDGTAVPRSLGPPIRHDGRRA